MRRRVLETKWWPYDKMAEETELADKAVSTDDDLRPNVSTERSFRLGLWLSLYDIGEC